MPRVQKFSSHVIDYAERLSTMADAAEGKRKPKSGAARWVVLPATGAALYALVKNRSFSKQAKNVLESAKTRAADLPEDLVGRVRETVDRGTSRQAAGNGAGAKRRSTSRKAKSAS